MYVLLFCSQLSASYFVRHDNEELKTNIKLCLKFASLALLSLVVLVFAL
jgi:hypothetical protein